MLLKQPPDVDDVTDGKPMRTGYTHQFRISWTGKAFLKNFVVRSSHQPDSQTGPVVEDQTCRELDCCDINPNDYQINGDAATSIDNNY